MTTATAAPALDLYARAEEAAAFLRSRVREVPKVAVVLGSGLGAFAESLEGGVAVPYPEIPHWPAGKVIGHSGTFHSGRLAGLPVIALSGRVHYYEGHPMPMVAFPVRVLARLGVRGLVLTNAAGAVNKSFSAGRLMLISDHLNLLGGNPLIGANDDRFGTRFPDLSEAYSRALRDEAKKVAEGLGIGLFEGVYAAMTGPSYESPAEIRMLRTMGADAVGMSTVPEVIAARHCGMSVLAISCLSNMAAGVLDQPLDHSEVLAVGRAVAGDLLALLKGVLPSVARVAEGA